MGETQARRPEAEVLVEAAARLALSARDERGKALSLRVVAAGASEDRTAKAAEEYAKGLESHADRMDAVAAWLRGGAAGAG